MNRRHIILVKPEHVSLFTVGLNESAYTVGQQYQGNSSIGTDDAQTFADWVKRPEVIDTSTSAIAPGGFPNQVYPNYPKPWHSLV